MTSKPGQEIKGFTIITLPVNLSLTSVDAISIASKERTDELRVYPPPVYVKPDRFNYLIIKGAFSTQLTENDRRKTVHYKSEFSLTKLLRHIFSLMKMHAMKLSPSSIEVLIFKYSYSELRSRDSLPLR